MDSVYKERVRKFRWVETKEEIVVPAGEVIISPDERIISGWKVKWRDWQYIANSDARVGIWIAYPVRLEGWCLYSAYPGACGPFFPNAVFDLSIREWQTLPSLLSSDFELSAFKQEALEKLLELIQDVGQPPYDPYAKQREEMLSV